MITPIIPRALATVCNVGGGVEARHAELFLKYWIESHFLLGNHLYVYKKKELFDEARYQKPRLIKFINNLGYLGEGTHVEEIKNKCLQRLINVQLMIGGFPWEEINIIFGTFQNLHDLFLLCLSMTYLFSHNGM